MKNVTTMTIAEIQAELRSYSAPEHRERRRQLWQQLDIIIGRQASELPVPEIAAFLAARSQGNVIKIGPCITRRDKNEREQRYFIAGTAKIFGGEPLRKSILAHLKELGSQTEDAWVDETRVNWFIGKAA